MDFERLRSTTPLKSNLEPSARKGYIPGLHLDNAVLDMICKLICTDSQYVKRGSLINIAKFLDSVNPKEYMNDPEKSKFVSFIRKGLEARLAFNLTNPGLIVRHINGGMLDDHIIDVSHFVGLGNNDINWVNEMISSVLKYDYVYAHVDHMIDVCTRFKTNDYASKVEIVQEIEDAVNSAQNDFRRSRNEAATEMIFSLKEGVFEDAVVDSYNQLANPRRKLRTGMQGLNELLGGGFESGRLYIIFGLPGEGKSSTLLDLIYQLKKYNTDYKCKDPTKRPCILLLTMENTIVETIERLFGLACITNNSMIEYSVEEAINMLRTQGELRLDENSPIDIIVKFKPTNSVDTSYMYTIVDDLEDQGMEVIAVFQDYIGRIRSTERFSDSRLEYGAVTDEFKVFAEIKDIPVISASQLNRDASKHIDEGRKNSKADLVRLIGRSNISESMLVLNNIDGGFVIAPEYTQEGEKYLGIQRIKHRYHASERDFFYLPYMRGTLRLVEDLGREPSYKTTMRSESELFNSNRVSNYRTNPIVDLDQTMADDSELFGNGTFIAFQDSNSPDPEPIAAYNPARFNCRGNLEDAFHFYPGIPEPYIGYEASVSRGVPWAPLVFHERE